MPLSRSPVEFDGPEPTPSGGPRAEFEPLLALTGFGYGYGDRRVVRSMDLSLSRAGVLVLMGPSGAGKSSLLRILAGVCPPTLRTWGSASYQGAPLGEAPRPALVEQKARALVSSLFEGVAAAIPERASITRAQQRDRVRGLLEALGLAFTERELDAPVVDLPPALQRCAAVARGAASGAALLCVDEPCAGLDDRGRARVLGAVSRFAAERAVLFVSHNRLDALELGADVALLAGGVIQERAPAGSFFEAPRTEAGRQFARTGSCREPSVDATPDELDEGFVPSAPAVDALGMRWILPGQLAGFRRPGLLSDARADLAELARAGVRVLVCLEEQPAVAPADAAEFGLTTAHRPVADMAAPTVDAARAVCGEIDAHLAAGRPVGVHCRAGLGRTGSVLAAYLLWRGRGWPDALDEVRRVEPRFVQSAEQLDFLRAFADAIASTSLSNTTRSITEEQYR